MGALKHDRTRKGHEYTIIHDGHEYTQPYGWKISQEKVEKLIQENRIHFVPKSKNVVHEQARNLKQEIPKLFS